MSSNSGGERLGRGYATAIWISVGLVLMGGAILHSLWDSDEPRFAEATRDMFVRGDFLVPHLNGEPRYDKPILIYWAQGAFFFWSGRGSAIGARAPSVFGLALAAIFTARIGSRIFGRGAGLASGLILAATVQTSISGRAATADGLLLCCVMLTLDGLHARLHGRRTRSTWLQLYGGLALCMLAKGPPGWATPICAAVGVYIASRRKLDRKRFLSATCGVLFALLVVAAWFIPADISTKGEFHRHALGHHFLARAGGGVEGHGGLAPWWFLYYIPVLLIGFFPWSAWLPQLWRHFRKGIRRREDRLFLGAWAIGTFLIFTASIGKRPHYILPLYPALAIVTGGLIAARFAEKRSLFPGRWGLVSLLFLVLFGGAMAAAVPVAMSRLGFGEHMVAALVPGTVLAACLLALLLVRRHARPRLQAALAGGGVALFFLLVLRVTIPRVEERRLVPEVASALTWAAPPGSRRAWRKFRPDSLVFYSQRDDDWRLSLTQTTPIERVYRGKDVLALLESEEPAAIVLTEEERDQILEAQGIKRLPGCEVKKIHGFYARKARWETVYVYSTNWMWPRR